MEDVVHEAKEFAVALGDHRVSGSYASKNRDHVICVISEEKEGRP